MKKLLFLLLFLTAAQVKAQNSEEVQRAISHFMKDEFAPAIPLFEKNLAGLRLVFEDEPDKLRKILTMLSISYQRNYQNEKADALKKELAQMNEQAPESWDVLSQKGRQAMEEKKYPEAEVYLNKAKKRASKQFGEKHENYVFCCHSLALLYESTGRYSEAEKLYLEGKNIREKLQGKKHKNYASSCNKLGFLYSNIGRYTEAESLFSEALKIQGEVLEKQDAAYITFANNLAALYFIQGRYSESEPIYVALLEIVRSKFGEKNKLFAGLCNNLAGLYLKTDRYTQSAVLYTSSLTAWEKLSGKTSREYASACNNLGALFLDGGHYQKAADRLTEAFTIRKELLGENHPDYAESCHNLARLHQALKEFDKAEFLLKKAKNLRKELFGKNHPDYALSAGNLAALFVAQGRLEEAESLYLEILTNKKAQIQDLFPGMAENQRKEFVRSIDHFFTDFYAFSVLRYKDNLKISEALFNFQIARKGLLFQSFQKMKKQILKSGNEQLIAQYEDWKNKRTYLSKISVLTKPERKEQGIDEAKIRRETHELESQISRSSEVYGRAIRKNEFRWENIRKQLGKDEVFVELIRVNTFRKETGIVYIALIVSNKTQNYPEMIVLDGNLAEKKHLKLYRNKINYLAKDRDSYGRYWGKIAEKIKGYKKVYFSPDGVYHKINLLTLWNPETGQYLAEDTDIRLIGSPKDLLEGREAGKKEAGDLKKLPIFLFGFPKYDEFSGTAEADWAAAAPFEKEETGDASQRFWKGGQITPLHGTKTEVENIEAVALQNGFPVDTHFGLDANEGNVKKLNSPFILHIATHGFFRPNVPEKAGVLPAGGNRNISGKNPFLRSGVLLAGAGKTWKGIKNKGEDGVFYAEEALSLDLEGTDLVVLSACETGLGDISNGEGVYGLQRSFRQAGAKTVLMSLWKVSDAATQKMMTFFYQNLLEKRMSKNEAFRAAQKSLREESPEPYYWGAFVLIGE